MEREREIDRQTEREQRKRETNQRVTSFGEGGAGRGGRENNSCCLDRVLKGALEVTS